MALSALAKLTSLFEAEGFPQATCPLLHPADLFIDLAGEDIRQRLFLTDDGQGHALCLRPEFTIPLCMARREEIEAAPLRFGYAGVVFRQRKGESGEFVQAGAECLGRDDRIDADAEMIALAARAADVLGEPRPRLRLGDLGILEAVLHGLKATPGFARRLKRRLAAGMSAQEAVQVSGSYAESDRYGTVINALGGSDRAVAKAFVEDLMQISGASGGVGRSVGDIADRFLAKAREGGSRLQPDHLQTLVEILSISADPDTALASILKKARHVALDIEAAVDSAQRRIAALRARSVSLERATFSPAFVRSQDYYTGLVFEMHAASGASVKPLIGGGRYDGLMQRLGTNRPIPAVGFSIWVERFATVDEGAVS